MSDSRKVLSDGEAADQQAHNGRRPGPQSREEMARQRDLAELEAANRELVALLARIAEIGERLKTRDQQAFAEHQLGEPDHTKRECTVDASIKVE